MNTSKILNYIHSLYFFAGSVHNPVTITCDRVQQRDGTFLWKVMKGGSSLSKEGFFGYEPMPSSRDQNYLNEHRFESLEAACKGFNAFLEAQSDPEHKFYVKGYQRDLDLWKSEFSLLLKDLEITL